MTRSVSRIAKRAAKFDEPAFAMPPDGMLSDRIDLIPYRLVLGLVHPDDCPILVAVWNGEGWKMLLPEQAGQWADELIAAGQAVPLAPVIEALRKLVKRVGDVVVETIARQAETVH